MLLLLQGQGRGSKYKGDSQNWVMTRVVRYDAETLENQKRRLEVNRLSTRDTSITFREWSTDV